MGASASARARGGAPEPPGRLETVFGDICRGRGCRIEKTEERGLTLSQLCSVWAHIQKRCVLERWTNAEGGLLKPENTNLYDTVRYVIKPATAERKCSYVELVASGPQRPKWFVSHWWGEPVVLFLHCIDQHAADHGLDEYTPYWICAYANNQHYLGNELTTNPGESAFVKAIQISDGRVLSVMDFNGVTYGRIWCCLEIYLALMYDTYEVYTAPKGGCLGPNMTSFDQTVAAMPAGISIKETWEIIRQCMNFEQHRNAVGITDGPAERDGNEQIRFPYIKVCREKHFPLNLVHAAFDFQIQDGKATVQSDRINILKYIESSLRAERAQAKSVEGAPNLVPKKGLEYEDVNAKLHGRYAQAFWRMVLEGKGINSPLMKRCTEKLKASKLKRLSFSMQGCEAFDDVALLMLIEHLPPTLESLEMDMVGSAVASGKPLLEEIVVYRSQHTGFAQLSMLSLPRCKLGTKELTCSFPDQICSCTQLEYLRLESNNLTGTVPERIGNCSSLVDLYLFDNNLEGCIPASIGQCSNLQRFYSGHNNFNGCLPDEIGRCTALRKVFLGNNSLESGISELCKLSNLEVLFLNDNQFSGTINLCHGQWPKLNALFLHNNAFDGELPTAFSGCGELSTLTLMNNARLKGESIGLALKGCLKLEQLYLDSSQRESLSVSMDQTSLEAAACLREACEAGIKHLRSCTGADDLPRQHAQWEPLVWAFTNTYLKDAFSYSKKF